MLLLLYIVKHAICNTSMELGSTDRMSGPGSVCAWGGGGGDVEIFHCHRVYVERFH